jgi:hypothetical protein
MNNLLGDTESFVQSESWSSNSWSTKSSKKTSLYCKFHRCPKNSVVTGYCYWPLPQLFVGLPRSPTTRRPRRRIKQLCVWCIEDPSRLEHIQHHGGCGTCRFVSVHGVGLKRYRSFAENLMCFAILHHLQVDSKSWRSIDFSIFFPPSNSSMDWFKDV